MDKHLDSSLFLVFTKGDNFSDFQLGRIVQSVVHLTHEPEVPVSISGPAIYYRFSFP